MEAWRMADGITGRHISKTLTENIMKSKYPWHKAAMGNWYIALGRCKKEASPKKLAALPVQGGARYKVFNAELVIRNASDGKKYLYDIVSIKENTGLALDLNNEARGRRESGATRSDVSMDSIRRSERESQEKFSADDTTATPQENDKTALAYFGRTYKWSETGYVLLNGARLDFSGRHEGGSGGYRSARLGIQAEIRGCEKLQRERKIRLKSEDFSRIWSECRDSNPRPLGPEGWSDIFSGHFKAFSHLSAQKISQLRRFQHG